MYFVDYKKWNLYSSVYGFSYLSFLASQVFFLNSKVYFWLRLSVRNDVWILFVRCRVKLLYCVVQFYPPFTPLWMLPDYALLPLPSSLTINDQCGYLLISKIARLQPKNLLTKQQNNKQQNRRNLFPIPSPRTFFIFNFCCPNSTCCPTNSFPYPLAELPPKILRNILP